MRQEFACGGASRTRLGGGRVIEPTGLVIGDRATLVKEYYVSQIAIESAKNWFRENLRKSIPLVIICESISDDGQ